jgi:hypothetical protein
MQLGKPMPAPIRRAIKVALGIPAQRGERLIAVLVVVTAEAIKLGVSPAIGAGRQLPYGASLVLARAQDSINTPGRSKNQVSPAALIDRIEVPHTALRDQLEYRSRLAGTVRLGATK